LYPRRQKGYARFVAAKGAEIGKINSLALINAHPSGCVSRGDTIEEALEMIKDAIEGHLDILEEDGKQMRLISVVPKLGTTEI